MYVIAKKKKIIFKEIAGLEKTNISFNFFPKLT